MGILAQEPLVQAKTTFTTPHHKVQTYTHQLAAPVTHHQTHHVEPVTAPVVAQAPVAVAPVAYAAHAVPAAYGYGHHAYAAPHHFAPHAAHFGYAGFPHGFPNKVISPVAAEE